MDAPSRDQINPHLKQLACEAKQHPPRSRERRRTLTKLMQSINKIRDLYPEQIKRPQRGSYSADVYQELYEEAWQRTMEKICCNIESYKPESPESSKLERPVMAWVNNWLKWNFLAVSRESRNPQVVSLPLDKLDRFAAVEETPSEADWLRNLLEEDPEDRFKSVAIQGHPEVTFQVLALARGVEDQSWKQLSTELGISMQTLSSFYHRQLREFKPYFQQHLQG